MSETKDLSKINRVCVIGLGYIGLPTAAVLASRGFLVHGVEVNQEAIETINSGKAHIVEPDLDMLVQAAVQTGKLKAHSHPSEADVFMICVPTPFKGNHEPDLSFVFAATRSIAPYVRRGNIVILESTSPPGTTEEMASIIESEVGLTSQEVHFAHAPERVLPGRVLREVVENDRVVGGVGEIATSVCAKFYSEFVRGEVLKTNARTAEMTKLVENASRDVNIAFANELSVICDEQGIDVWEVIRLANRHPRVNILAPGPGVGGHCIAVDPWFIVSKSPKSAKLIRAAREVNDSKPHWVVERVVRRAGRIKEPKIACLGLAYKADIDDLRESPSVEIVRELIRSDVGDIRIVEPYIARHPEFKLQSLGDAIRDADIIVGLVGHRLFKSVPTSKLRECVVIDACGMFNRE